MTDLDPIEKALKRASLFSLLLSFVKFISYYLSGSVIVLATLLDSLMDTAVSFINSRFHKVSREHPDSEHPYGHGGFEVISSLLQGTFIFLSGVYIIFESIDIWQTSRNMTAILKTFPLAVSVLIAASISGFLINIYLKRVKNNSHSLNENRNRSLSLESDIAHYRGDFFINLAGAIGLTLSYVTKNVLFDSIFGAIGGLLLLFNAYPILKQCYFDITQKEISPEMQKKIVDTVLESHHKIYGIHKLRSRQIGPIIYLDFHLKLPKDIILKEAHAISDLVESKLIGLYSPIDVIIHLDPDDEKDEEPWKPSYKPKY